MSMPASRVVSASARALRLTRVPRVPVARLFSTGPAASELFTPGLRVRPVLRMPQTSRLMSTTARVSNSAASASSSSSSASSGRKKSAYQRFKELSKTYGLYAVVMYLLLGAVDFSASFLLVHSVGAERLQPYVSALVRKYRLIRFGEARADEIEAEEAAKRAQEALEEEEEARRNGGPVERPWYLNKTLWAEAALAYTIHKVPLLPVRATITVAWTPKVVNFLRSRGWIGAAGTKRAAAHGVEKAKAAGNRVMDAVRRN